jgi:hypothetical protein
LRANVEDDRDPALPHLPRRPPIESGRVDYDSDVGRPPVSLSNQLVKQAIDFGKMADDLGDANDGKVL